MADLLAEYQDRGKSVPYDKIDSPVFEAMFQFLETEEDTVKRNI